MSYSRWSDSVWYTYYTAFSPPCEFRLPTKKLKGEQLFEICDFPSYFISYEDIIDLGVDVVLQNVNVFYSKGHDGKNLKEVNVYNDGFIYEKITYPPKNPTNEELEELRTYIEMFKEDVDNDFKLMNFIRNNWYFPLRSKVKFFYKAKFINWIKTKLTHLRRTLKVELR